MLILKLSATIRQDLSINNRAAWLLEGGKGYPNDLLHFSINIIYSKRIIGLALVLIHDSGEGKLLVSSYMTVELEVMV